MTDNDWRNAMIEEAAAKRYPHRDVFLEGGAYMAEERSRVSLREAFVEGAKWQAKKALGEATVTPTAHEVTTDERKALARAIDPTGRTGAWAGRAVDRAFAAGFRRYEVPESNAEDQGSEAQCRILPLQHRVQNPSHHGSAAQGEPSDAQVLAALNAYYADYMIHPNKSLDDVRPPRTVQDMRAALRAAMSLREGEVR